MKASILIGLLVLSSTALAQDVITDLSASRPDGATGPGVQFTQRVVGRIIAVGSPITRAIQTGYTCPHHEPERRTKEHSTLNGGTVLGAIIGGVAGSQVGDGRGKTAATITGTTAGALIGNNVNKRMHESKFETTSPQTGCTTTFEHQIIGWTFTAEYAGIQMQGTMRRQPQVGEDVMVIITSVLYAGS